MAKQYGEPIALCDCGLHENNHDGSQMSGELLTLLRQRVATRFYDQPQVIDRIARALIQNHESRMA
jgi:hypothetical protein